MKTCVLITSYNRGRLLETSLTRMTYLTKPDEVLVIDDGSNDHFDATKRVCEGFKDKLNLRYIYNHNPEWSICSMARNIGIKNTDADIIITTEPELIWITDIVPQMLKSHEEHPNEIINIGTIYHMQEQATLNGYVEFDAEKFISHEIVEDYQSEPRPYNPKGFVKTVNLQATFCTLYEKKWLMNVGGWDEAFEGWGFDDIDLCTRLRIKEHIGQYNDLSMRAIHQWHPHLLPHIQGPAMQRNEQRMKDKNLGDNDLNNPNLIANAGKLWGQIVPKPLE